MARGGTVVRKPAESRNGGNMRPQRPRQRWDGWRAVAGDRGEAGSSIARRRGIRARRTGVLLLVVAVAVSLWMVFLGMTLPAQNDARHWNAAWLGLDAMEVCGLAASGVLLLKQDMRVGAVAGATAALLVADAWFDITTAQTGWDYLLALTLAGVGELPLAAICALIAWKAPRHCAPAA